MLIKDHLKILHIINVPRFNAVAWYGVNTAYSQMLLGHEVHISGDIDSPSLKKALELRLHKQVELNFSRPNPISQFACAFKLKKYIEDNEIDIVNAHQGNGYYAIAAGVRLAKNNPILVRTRGDIRYPKNNFFNRLLYTRLSHGIIATSGVTYKRMTENFRIQDITTIYPAVDEKHFQQGSYIQSELKKRYDVSPETVLFGLVGRIDSKKGHHVAFSALRRVLDKGIDARFVVAGPEENITYNELNEFALETRVIGRVIFLGRVPDVREVMAACDCAIIPSTDSEAICRVGLEFMALKVPLIASNLNGIPDILKDGVTGLLFKTGDSQDLAEKMVKFIEMKPSWPVLKENARRAVEENHSLTGLGKKTIEFYRTLLEKRNFRK